MSVTNFRTGDGFNALKLTDEQLSALDDALNYYAHCGYGTGYSPVELHDADGSVLDETQWEHVTLMRQVYTIVLDAQEAAVRRAA